MFFQQGFRGLSLVAALPGDLQAHRAFTPGQACCAAAERAGQADVVVALALQPEQGAAAGVARGADADLAVDLPGIQLAELLLVGFPGLRIALAFQGFVGGQAGAAAEQGQRGGGEEKT